MIRQSVYRRIFDNHRLLFGAGWSVGGICSMSEHIINFTGEF